MPLPFQVFQRRLAGYLRDPHHVQRPAGVKAKPAAIYSGLLFNNVCGFLDTCFPVCRQVLGPRRWQRLSRTFYRDWPLTTPFFREIPREFVAYLEQGDVRTPLPRWFRSLARYEWAELAVDVMEASVPAYRADGDLLASQVVLNPARVDLVFDWPVHRVGPAWQPRQAQSTYLVVYRSQGLNVQFTEVNAVTARLLECLSAPHVSGELALMQLARATGFPDEKKFIEFGATVLLALREQGVILGVAT